ncbi:Uncharacterised protein [Streptococcus pneumoniae]|nr:Uncharacterised protein [Streptococcus pneumoniae]
MDKMKPVFQALNKELIQENLTLTIIIWSIPKKCQKSNSLRI